MFSFPLSIPHMVLSSRQTLNGEISLHTLTPFGQIEISFSVSPSKNEQSLPLDIRVEGDRILWMLDGSIPASFRHTIVGFVGKIALLHSRRPMNRPCQLNVVFQNDSGEITLTGLLSPCAFANADG